MSISSSTNISSGTNAVPTTHPASTANPMPGPNSMPAPNAAPAANAVHAQNRRAPFWPDHSPHFLKCRLAVRPFIRARHETFASQTTPAPTSHTPASPPIVVGLSGGPDSLALVAACLAERAEVHAVIVDHQLQPGSADVAEEARCQAQQLGATADVVKVSVPEGGSLEANARAARYRALLNAASITQPGATSTQPPAASTQPEVFIAHTLDDQAETYLLGGLRGNPGGMAVREGRIVRPFLSVRRADTEGACQELGLTPWHDPQNEDPAFLRVLIRTQVVPDLAATVGFDPAPALAQAASRCAENRQAVAQVAQAFLNSAASPTQPGALSVRALAAQPRGVRTAVIEAFLRSAGARVNRQILTQVENLVVNWHGQGPVSLGSFLEVLRVNGKLIVSNCTAPEE